ncbi:uncharacterized protein MKK02DRAFT_44090 [Dioszegia hungarica]|uniref:J domain-containing protein n=1 Tax=Dioszegia hungarica TaxID=4972 RepID=A0AA38H6D7_9TREE|nr:uncharacterized protein MKK02DRAFT_44090 [Dioszegia hungarica]KAI9635402.1 hypothetical protein MKK02DRAFT_44090 [Dioszegia hungarica]
MIGRSARAIASSSASALRIVARGSQIRYGHAARAPSENEEAADPAQEPQAGPSRLQGGTRGRVSAKGKEKATDDYRLAMILHPDSSHPSSSPEHFAMLHRAYSLLSSSQSRSSYLQSGFGWSPTGQAVRDSWSDAQMRSEVHARRRGGAAAWETGSRGYRSAEAGWAQQEEQWQYGDEFRAPPKGTGEVIYMSNKRFISIFAGVSVLIAWIQYHRIGIASETHRELLQAQHQSASSALAEARRDAARYGKERRERIRRRVREIEVVNEVEKLEAGRAEGAPADTLYDQD